MDNSLPTQPIVPIQPVMPPQPAPALPPTPPTPVFTPPASTPTPSTTTPQPWQPSSVPQAGQGLAAAQSASAPSFSSQPNPVSQPTLTVPPTPPKSGSKFLMILIPLLLVLVAAGVGAFYYLQNNPNPFSQKVAVTPTPIPDLPEEPVACTLEAKLCPDGSSVGRGGPNCEFAECPVAPEGAGVSMNTYSNSAVGYTIKHLPTWSVVDIASGVPAPATAASRIVEIQSPGLTQGNVTLQIIPTVADPIADQTKTEEVINGVTYVVYVTTVENVVSKTYFIPAKNNSYLEVLMRPVNSDTSATFQTMMESLVVPQ